MPQPQDNFWSTILWFFLIPAGVGIGASLVANFLYPILISSLESRKFISNQKRKLPQNWIASSSACTTARRIKSNILFDGILWLLYWRPVIIGILSLQFPPTLQGQPIGAIRADFIGAIVCSSSLCVLGLIGILLALRVLRRLRTIRFALNDYDRFLKTRNPAVGSS